MRVVTQEQTIQRNRQIAQIAFFASLAGLVGAFLFGNQLAGSNEAAAVYFNCGILPTLFLLILFAVRMANNWIREPLPWQALQEATVESVGRDDTLYNYIMMPARHVLITTYGVFLLLPLFQDRPVVINGDRWTMPGGLFARILIFMRQEGLNNPIFMATAEAEYVEKLINRRIDAEITVQPVIVFVSPQAAVMVENEPSVPATFAKAEGDLVKLADYLEQKRKDHKDNKPILTAEQIEALDDELLYIKAPSA